MCHHSLFSALEAEIILHEPWPLMAFLLPLEEIVRQGASATITVGVLTPTVIVALAPWHTISSGGRRKAISGQGSCKIISASKAENKERWHLLLLLDFLTIILLLLLRPISKVIYYYYYYSKGYYYYYYYYLTSYCV